MLGRGSSYNPSDFLRNLRHSLKLWTISPQPGSQAHPHPSLAGDRESFKGARGPLSCLPDLLCLSPAPPSLSVTSPAQTGLWGPAPESPHCFLSCFWRWRDLAGRDRERGRVREEGGWGGPRPLRQRPSPPPTPAWQVSPHSWSRSRRGPLAGPPEPSQPTFPCPRGVQAPHPGCLFMLWGDMCKASAEGKGVCSAHSLPLVISKMLKGRKRRNGSLMLRPGVGAPGGAEVGLKGSVTAAGIWRIPADLRWLQQLWLLLGALSLQARVRAGTGHGRGDTQGELNTSASGRVWQERGGGSSPQILCSL